MAGANPPTTRWAGTGRSRRTERAISASSMWNGARYAQVLYNDVPASKNDRAVRLGPDHLPGDHRSAGLRADFRQPDARRVGRAAPRDGDPFVADRLGHIDVLRPARAAPAPRAWHLTRQLPHRGRDHAVLHRRRHGVRTAHRAARKARRSDRADARDRGHQRVPDGHADDRRAGIDRQRDAVGLAGRRPAPYRGRARARSRR